MRETLVDVLATPKGHPAASTSTKKEDPWGCSAPTPQREAFQTVFESRWADLQRQSFLRFGHGTIKVLHPLQLSQ